MGKWTDFSEPQFLFISGDKKTVVGIKDDT